MDALPSSPILVDQVYERLMSAIAERRLKPGERIRQGQLAASLGVSRQPVSHALQLLKHQGLLRESGRQGLEVVPLDPERIDCLYRARSALDGLAARLAAERAASGRLSEPERRKLSGYVSGTFDLGPDVELRELVQADVDFHQMLYALSGNPVIPELVAPQWPHLRRSMMAVLEQRSFRSRVLEEHAEIAHCVLSGDADAAEAAASRHAIDAGQETALRLKSAERSVSRAQPAASAAQLEDAL